MNLTLQIKGVSEQLSKKSPHIGNTLVPEEHLTFFNKSGYTLDKFLYMVNVENTREVKYKCVFVANSLHGRVCRLVGDRFTKSKVSTIILDDLTILDVSKPPYSQLISPIVEILPFDEIVYTERLEDWLRAVGMGDYLDSVTNSSNTSKNDKSTHSECIYTISSTCVPTYNEDGTFKDYEYGNDKYILMREGEIAKVLASIESPQLRHKVEAIINGNKAIASLKELLNSNNG